MTFGPPPMSNLFSTVATASVYRPMLFHSIRLRLLVLVLIAIVPFMALIGVGSWSQWQDNRSAAIQRALNEARLIAAQVDDHIGNLEHLLVGLSQAVSVNPADTASNDATMRRMKAEMPDFISNIGIFSPDGRNIGIARQGEGGRPSVRDRVFFKTILAGQRLSVGDVDVGRALGKWVVNIGRRIEDKTGRLVAVLGIGTLLEHFQDALRVGGLPAGSVVRIVNEHGIVVAQSANGPNWIGRDLSKSEHVIHHLAAGEASEFATWLDGIERITGSSTAHRVPWLVSVGLPTEVASATLVTRLSWGVCLSAIAIILAFAIAWSYSSRVVRPLQQLKKDAAVLADGDLRHRSTIDTPDEVGDLATSFNLMAQSLEQQQAAAKRSADEVRQAKDTLAALIESIPVPIVVKEVKSLRIVLVNRAYEKFMGISRDEMMEKTTSQLFPPQDGDRILDLDNKAVQSDELIVSGEFPVNTPNHGLRIVTTTRLPVRGPNQTAQHLMVVVEDVTDRRKAEEKIFHMAHHDALTGLPNRVRYYERLKQELNRVKRGGQFAVLYLDLDNFKIINDSLGHSIGDELLVTVADRLRGCISETDTIARLSGDEFAIIQTDIDRAEDSCALANRIQEALKAPLDLGGLCAATSVSIGISVAPANASTPDELMKQADMALYKAKAAGRNTHRLFEPEMDARMKARRSIESDLRNAIVKGELKLHYQPVVDLRSGAIVGMEALVRWLHPTRGMLSPAEFIPIAEETGLINPLGEWVLRQACADAAKWPPAIKVALNLSPAQVKDRKLLHVLLTSMAAVGLLPSRLELEITEHVLLQDDDSTLSLLHQLHELGVQIVLDDFGKKYSSLNYLRRFPLNKIKIDRSFIGDLSEENAVSIAIVQAVVGLASALKLRTTAEGVETEDQLELVRKAGCNEMQGFLFSPPKPIEELLGLFPQSAEAATHAA